MTKQPLLMLDSGAFSAMTQGVIIDIDQYAEFLSQHEHLFNGGCINLDVIYFDDNPKIKDRAAAAAMSYDNWIYLRRKGLNTIPVYHLGTDEKWLRRYLYQTDYVAIGAIANVSTSMRLSGLDYIWNTFLRDSNGLPKYRVHGLGLTSYEIMSNYPWYSVDSNTSIKVGSYGGILVPLNAEKLGTQRRRRYIHGTDLLSVLVSDRVNKTWTTRYYYGMSQTIKNRICDFCQSMGYELPTEVEPQSPTLPLVQRRDIRRKLIAAAIRELTQADRNWITAQQITLFLRKRYRTIAIDYNEIREYAKWAVKKWSHHYEQLREDNRYLFRYTGHHVKNDNVFLKFRWHNKATDGLLNLEHNYNGVSSLNLSNRDDIRIEFNFRVTQRYEETISSRRGAPFHVYNAVSSLSRSHVQSLKMAAIAEDVPAKLLTSFYFITLKGIDKSLQTISLLTNNGTDACPE